MSETLMKKFRFNKTGPSNDYIDDLGIIHRKCSKCGTIKQLSEGNFWRQQTTRSGFRSKCKLCLGYQSKKKWGIRNQPSKQEQGDKHKRWKSQQPSGVYAITCNKNNKVYIGESKCLSMRFHSHKSDLKLSNRHTNTALQKDWDLYGEQSFTFEILEITQNNKKHLVERERFYIDEFRKQGKKLYNSY